MTTIEAFVVAALFNAAFRYDPVSAFVRALNRRREQSVISMIQIMDDSHAC